MSVLLPLALGRSDPHAVLPPLFSSFSLTPLPLSPPPHRLQAGSQPQEQQQWQEGGRLPKGILLCSRLRSSAGLQRRGVPNDPIRCCCPSSIWELLQLPQYTQAGCTVRGLKIFGEWGLFAVSLHCSSSLHYNYPPHLLHPPVPPAFSTRFSSAQTGQFLF